MKDIYIHKSCLECDCKHPNITFEPSIDYLNAKIVTTAELEEIVRRAFDASRDGCTPNEEFEPDYGDAASYIAELKEKGVL